MEISTSGRARKGRLDPVATEWKVISEFSLEPVSSRDRNRLGFGQQALLDERAELANLPALVLELVQVERLSFYEGEDSGGETDVIP